MKLKKLFKFLACLLVIPTLTGCSFFSKEKEETKEQIVIKNASFEYTYSSITFTFEKDINAIYYNAIFTGQYSTSISRIESGKTYKLPDEMPDGKYNVFISAIANLTHENSEPYNLGEMDKFKKEANSENLSIVAETTNDYGIALVVYNSNKEITSPIAVRIYKDDELQSENIVRDKETFTTAKDLDAGSYKISAFFKESDNYLASDEKFLDEALVIPQRKLKLTSFMARYDEGEIFLTWSQENIKADKKLIVSYDGIQTTYINTVQNKAINSGMILDATEFGKGEISFALSLEPKERIDTFISSDTANASTIISSFKEKTPNISVEYSEEGDVIINKNDSVEGLYDVEIKAVGNPFDDSTEHDIFNYKETISTFPLVFKKANETWRHSNYEITVYKLSSSSLSENSDSFIAEVKVDDIELLPNISTQKNILQDGGFEITITANAPKWLNLDWTPDEYVYDISLTGCGDFLCGWNLTEQNKQITLPFYSSDMASSEYWLYANTFFYGSVPYGYKKYGTTEIDIFEFKNDRPIDNYIVENLSAGDTLTNRSGVTYSPTIRISLEKKFAYAGIYGSLHYKKSSGENEEIEFNFGEKEWEVGSLSTDLRMEDFLSRSQGGYIYILVKAYLGDYYTELEWYQPPIKPPVS